MMSPGRRLSDRRGLLRPTPPRPLSNRTLSEDSLVAMVKIMGEGDLLAIDILTGSLGVRVVNMIMTPAMFAQLEAVSTDVLNIARNILAWEGLEIHIEHMDMHLWDLARMVSIWSKANALHLRYPEAGSLDHQYRVLSTMYTLAAHDRRCPIAADWRFPMTDVRILPGMEEEDGSIESYLHLSSAVFSAGQEVFFDMVFPAHGMPCFDVGWMCDDHDIWTHLCFRVMPEGVPFTAGDRARFYAGCAMSEDRAIRVPSSWTGTSPQSRLVIMLKFTETSMILGINDDRWEAEIEPKFRRRWSRRTHRSAILALTPEPHMSLPTIEPHPWYIQ